MTDFDKFPNIQRYREAKGISIKEVAKNTKLLCKHYKNIEIGNAPLTNEVLYAISKVLKVAVPKLIYYDSKLQNVRFRSRGKLKDRKLIILETEHWINEYNYIEDQLEDYKSNPLEEIRKQISVNQNTIAEVARLTREKFGLNVNEPIFNICGLLESNGIKVGEHKVKSNDFFGFSIYPEDSGPAIVINTWSQIPVERWIFTVAHELGHLVLHCTDFDVDLTIEGKKHEKEANEFALEFLMPEASFKKVWREFCGLSFAERVVTVKRMFRVSYKTLLFRLATLIPDAGDVWTRFESDYKRINEKPELRKHELMGLAKNVFHASFPEFSIRYEPENLSIADFMCCRFVGLVRRALEEHKISLGRGAEILQISRQELRDIFK